MNVEEKSQHSKISEESLPLNKVKNYSIQNNSFLVVFYYNEGFY